MLVEKSEPRISVLDSMRGLAALMVCLQHVLDHAQWEPTAMPERALRGVLRRAMDGGAAVDFFFVLSGFVLALPYLGIKGRALHSEEFLLRRVIRIMPAYWGSLIGVLALRAMVPSAFELTTTTEVAHHFALVFDPSVGKLNSVIWSLVIEMQVSVVLPLVIAAFAQRPTFPSVLATLFISAIIPQFIWGDSGLYYLPLFVGGCAIAYYQTELLTYARACSPTQRTVLWLLVAALFWNRRIQPWWQAPDMGAEYVTAVGAGLAIVLVLSRPRAPIMLSLRPVRFLGEISYSFYLMHLPILIVMTGVLRATRVSESVVVAGSFLLALAGSTALHYAIERPSIRWGKTMSRWLATRRAEELTDRSVSDRPLTN